MRLAMSEVREFRIVPTADDLIGMMRRLRMGNDVGSCHIESNAMAGPLPRWLRLDGCAWFDQQNEWCRERTK